MVPGSTIASPPTTIPEFDPPPEEHCDDICQLDPNTPDGFPEPEVQVHYDTVPDPPFIADILGMGDQCLLQRADLVLCQNEPEFLARETRRGYLEVDDCHRIQ
jgi:hypothetical protein